MDVAFSLIESAQVATSPWPATAKLRFDALKGRHRFILRVATSAQLRGEMFGIRSARTPFSSLRLRPEIEGVSLLTEELELLLEEGL